MYIIVKYTHMCKSAHVCTSVEFTGHMSSLISSPLFFFFFKMGFLHRTLLIWLRSFKALPLRLHITQHCHSALQMSTTMPRAFYEGAGKQNSGHHVCMAEVILTEPSL